MLRLCGHPLEKVKSLYMNILRTDLEIYSTGFVLAKVVRWGDLGLGCDCLRTRAAKQPRVGSPDFPGRLNNSVLTALRQDGP